MDSLAQLQAVLQKNRSGQSSRDPLRDSCSLSPVRLKSENGNLRSELRALQDGLIQLKSAIAARKAGRNFDRLPTADSDTRETRSETRDSDPFWRKPFEQRLSTAQSPNAHTLSTLLEYTQDDANSQADSAAPSAAVQAQFLTSLQVLSRRIEKLERTGTPPPAEELSMTVLQSELTHERTTRMIMEAVLKVLCNRIDLPYPIDEGGQINEIELKEMSKEDLITLVKRMSVKMGDAAKAQNLLKSKSVELSVALRSVSDLSARVVDLEEELGHSQKDPDQLQARTSVVSTLTMRIRSQNARIRYLTKEVATLRSVVEGSGGVQLIETSVSALKSVLDGLASDRRANLPSPAPSRAETRGRHLSNSSGTQDDRLPPRATDTLRARPVAQQLGNADNVLPHSLNTQTQRIDARSQRIDVHAHGMNPHSDILAMTPIDDDEMTVASEDASKGEKFAMSMTPPNRRPVHRPTVSGDFTPARRTSGKEPNVEANARYPAVNAHTQSINAHSRGVTPLSQGVNGHGQIQAQNVTAHTQGVLPHQVNEPLMEHRPRTGVGSLRPQSVQASPQPLSNGANGHLRSPNTLGQRANIHNPGLIIHTQPLDAHTHGANGHNQSVTAHSPALNAQSPSMQGESQRLSSTAPSEMAAPPAVMTQSIEAQLRQVGTGRSPPSVPSPQLVATSPSRHFPARSPMNSHLGINPPRHTPLSEARTAVSIHPRPNTQPLHQVYSSPLPSVFPATNVLSPRTPSPRDSFTNNYFPAPNDPIDSAVAAFYGQRAQGLGPVHMKRVRSGLYTFGALTVKMTLSSNTRTPLVFLDGKKFSLKKFVSLYETEEIAKKAANASVLGTPQSVTAPQPRDSPKTFNFDWRVPTAPYNETYPPRAPYPTNQASLRVNARTETNYASR